jgi:hypothetical protein
MIPEINNGVWENLVLGERNYQFQLLSLKILMSRIKVRIQNDNSRECIDKCKREVYDFFFKNERICQNDLLQILNSEGTL